MTELKPTSFKNGVPKAERNGLFGAEERLIDIARSGAQLVAIVTYAVPKVMHDEVADERYPVAEITHIEPLFEKELAEQAYALREAAYKARTNGDTLDLDEDEEGDE